MWNLYAEKEFDSLQKTRSIISMVVDNDLHREDPLRIDWNSDRIRVRLAGEIYREYCDLSGHLVPQTVDSLIFLPILISIISEWRYCGEEYETDNISYRWFRAIRARAEELNLLEAIRSDSASPFVLAQQLYDAPFARSMGELTKQWRSTEEEEA